MKFDINVIENEEKLIELIESDRVGEFGRSIDALNCLDVNADLDKQELLSLIPHLELTSLSPTDHREQIKQLFDNTDFDFGGVTYRVAGVCSFTNLLGLMNEYNKSKRVKNVVVSAGFPHSQMPLEAKKEEVRYAVCNGADEIDICLNRALFLSGSETKAAEEISVLKDLISSSRREVLLKVILETGELQTLSNVWRASLLALESGADFIKTSTGKISLGADVYSASVMLLALRKHYRKCGVIKGLKVAGGIREPLEAVKYKRLFEYFINDNIELRDNFRIGCSRLFDNLKSEIQNEN